MEAHDSRTAYALNIIARSALFFIDWCQTGSDRRTQAPTSLAENSTKVLLPVKVSGKWGYADREGHLVVSPQFDEADPFQEGKARVCIGKCSWFAAEVGEDSHWGFVDTNGKVIISPQYQFATQFSEGLAAVCSGDCSNKPKQPRGFGYVDGNGKVAIPLQFGGAFTFSESLAAVCVGECAYLGEDDGYSGKWGFVNHSGQFVINPQYDDADSFQNGVAKITVGKGKDKKFGYIDTSGKIVWQPSN